MQVIEIVVNGETRAVPEGMTVERLLAELNLPAERVAVELNRQIVRKLDWTQTPIEKGAHLEIVHFVGGG